MNGNSYMGAYCTQKEQLEQLVNQKVELDVQQMLMYQELNYRIQILESLAFLLNSAPRTDDNKKMRRHYMMVDAFLQHMMRERKYKKPALPDLQDALEVARESLQQIYDDFKARFASYEATTAKKYKQDVMNFVISVLMAWIVYRDMFLPIDTTSEVAA